MRDFVSYERLLGLLDYDPATGVFKYKTNWHCMRAGQIAGATRPDGYRILSIDGIRYKASRVAWFYMTGKWPKSYIDHKDRDVGNDRFSNLRDATPLENTLNRKTKIGRSGYRGVYEHVDGRWRARIMVNYKKIDLGIHGTKEAAAKAYDAAAINLFGHLAMPNFKENHCE